MSVRIKTPSAYESRLEDAILISFSFEDAISMNRIVWAGDGSWDRMSGEVGPRGREGVTRRGRGITFETTATISQHKNQKKRNEPRNDWPAGNRLEECS